MAAVRDRKHVNQPRDYALFALLANTGMRPSEALALTRADLHVHGRPPWVRLHRQTKKNAPALTTELSIHPKVARVIACFLAESKGDKPFPFTSRQSQRLFHYYLRAAGLQRRKIYALRHSAGMKLWRHSHDIRLMQAIMGHVRLKAAAVYVHTLTL